MAVSKYATQMRLYAAEKMLRFGPVNPHQWLDAPLSFASPRLAAYAAVRVTLSPGFAAFRVSDDPRTLITRALYHMRHALGNDQVLLSAVYLGPPKVEPAGDDEMAAAAKLYVERLDYWPAQSLSLSQALARWGVPAHEPGLPPIVFEKNFNLMKKNPAAAPVQVAPAQAPAPVQVAQAQAPMQVAPAPAQAQAPLCLDCGVATGRKATWMCTPCRCGPVTCGTCRQQRLLAVSGWTSCPQCGQNAHNFKRFY